MVSITIWERMHLRCQQHKERRRQERVRESLRGDRHCLWEGKGQGCHSQAVYRCSGMIQPVPPVTKTKKESPEMESQYMGHGLSMHG